jgi:hypothetical protein
MLIRCIDCNNNKEGECSAGMFNPIPSFMLTKEGFNNCISGEPTRYMKEQYSLAELNYKNAITDSAWDLH